MRDLFALSHRNSAQSVLLPHAPFWLLVQQSSSVLLAIFNVEHKTIFCNLFWKMELKVSAKFCRKMLNLAMKLEREKVLKASPYQRTEGRTGYANGFKERHIQTRMGDLVDIFYYFFCNFIKYFNFCWIFFMKWLSTTIKTGLEPIGG